VAAVVLVVVASPMTNITEAITAETTMTTTAAVVVAVEVPEVVRVEVATNRKTTTTETTRTKVAITTKQAIKAEEVAAITQPTQAVRNNKTIWC